MLQVTLVQQEPQVQIQQFLALQVPQVQQVRQAQSVQRVQQVYKVSQEM